MPFFDRSTCLVEFPLSLFRDGETGKTTLLPDNAVRYQNPDKDIFFFHDMPDERLPCIEKELAVRSIAFRVQQFSVKRQSFSQTPEKIQVGKRDL